VGAYIFKRTSHLLVFNNTLFYGTYRDDCWLMNTKDTVGIASEFTRSSLLWFRHSCAPPLIAWEPKALPVAIVDFGVPRTPTISYCGFGLHLFVLWDLITHSCNTGSSSCSTGGHQRCTHCCSCRRVLRALLLFHLGDTSIVGVVSTSGFSPSSVVIFVFGSRPPAHRRHRFVELFYQWSTGQCAVKPIGFISC
jgi:hypothetical protein